MSIQVIALESLRPPKARLRDFLGEMDEIKASIKQHGLLQPLVVRKMGTHFEVIAGHRRFQCLHELGVKEAECKVVEADDQMAFELALVENLERKSLDPIEEAKAFQKYTTDLGYGSIEQLSKILKKSPSFVVRRLELLKNEDVIPMIQTGKLTVSQAEELIGLDNEKASELADIAIKSDLSTTQIGVAKRYVKAGLDPEQAVNQVLQFPTLMPKESLHYDPIKVAREGVVSTTQQALHDVDRHLEYIPEGEERAQYIAKVRFPLHQIVDEAMKLRKRYTREKD